MVGELPEDYSVPWRQSALLQEQQSGPGGSDISGGWLAGIWPFNCTCPGSR